MRSNANDSGFFANGKLTSIPALPAVFLTLTPTASSDHRAKLGCTQIFVSVLHFSQSWQVPETNAMAKRVAFVHGCLLQVNHALKHFVFVVFPVCPKLRRFLLDFFWDGGVGFSHCKFLVTLQGQLRLLT